MIIIHKSLRSIALSIALAGGLGAGSALAQTSNSHDTVRSAQQQLKNSGYYTGAIDGVNGPMTRTAVRKYQKDNNLAVNGRLDRETRNKLGLQTTGEASREQNSTAQAASTTPAANQSTAAANQSTAAANQSTAAANQSALPSATISAAQRSLRDKGFYKGSVNGDLTRETHAAIREYQKNANLNVTGQLDRATLNSLGVSK